ncbi:MAG: hypothetical protein ACKOA1_03460, partial [Bacteroidota bacterium]
GTTYSWSPSTFLNTTSGATVTARPTTTTTYTVTGTTGSCTGSATVTVTVNNCNTGVSLDIVAFIEGYSDGNGSMVQSLKRI